MASFGQELSILNQAMTLRTQRHQVLASNIANADTPGYKARDFDFSAAMSGAMGFSGVDVVLAKTSSMHMAGVATGSSARLKYRSDTQSAVDGNTVDMDVERSQISENALQYQVLSQLIDDKFKVMRTALSSTSS